MNQHSPEKAVPLTTLQAADLYRMQVRELRGYAMFMIDPEGIITSWNAGVEQLIGYTEEQWIGQPASIIFTPQDKAVEMCQSEMVLAQETGSATDIRWHRHKNGTEFFANGFMNALRNEEGVLIGYAKIMSDETARKQLQDSLTESNSALEHLLTSRATICRSRYVRWALTPSFFRTSTRESWTPRQICFSTSS